MFYYSSSLAFPSLFLTKFPLPRPSPISSLIHEIFESLKKESLIISRYASLISFLY